MGSEFRKTVWKILCDIPYGKVTTYKKIAEEIAKQKGIDKKKYLLEHEKNSDM